MEANFSSHINLLIGGVQRYICGAVLGHVDEPMTTAIYAEVPSGDVLAERVEHHQREILNYLTFSW